MVRYKGSVITLAFEGGALDGVEIKCKTLRFRQVLGLARLAATLEQVDGIESLLSALDDIVPYFLASAQEWNVEDEDGNPIPIGQEGLEVFAWSDLEMILTSWMSNILGGEEDLKDQEEKREEIELDLPVEVLTPSL